MSMQVMLFGRRPVSISLALLISGLITMACMLMLLALLMTVSMESRAIAIQSAKQSFAQTTRSVIANINSDIHGISNLIRLAVLSFSASADHPTDHSRQLALLQTILDHHPLLMSVYIGYTDGRFEQLIAVRNHTDILAIYRAPPDTAYIHRLISHSDTGVRQQHWRFLDAAQQLLDWREDAEPPHYDPRTRPWYIQAMQTRQLTYTHPYVFSSSRFPGLTGAQVLADGSGVVGVDVTLEQLNQLLAQQRIFEQGRLWITDPAQHLLAYPGLAWTEMIGDAVQLPHATQLNDALVNAVLDWQTAHPDHTFVESFFLPVADEAYMISLAPIFSDKTLPMTLVIAASLQDITGHISAMVWRITWIAAISLLLVMPLALFFGTRASRAVSQLAHEAEKIRHFDFSPTPQINTSIKEVQDLALAAEVMKTTIEAKTESLLQTQKKLELVVQGGLALSAEKELAKLVTLIFKTACELARADGGVLYLLEGDTLEVEIVSLENASLVLGGLADHPAPRVMVRPAIAGLLCPDSVLRFACEAFNRRDTVIVRDTPLSLFPTGLPQEPTHYRIQGMIAVPIMTRQNQILGVIQVFNPQETLGSDAQDGNAIEVAGFIRSLAAQAAVTLDNRNLINSLRDVFDALVQVIAASIDAKSAYTGGHCIRVPVITELLAKAAHQVSTGPLADFRLETNEQWRQLWIASWLHDCGKVATPEYVVDKATKLETVYDRIHEIRIRFEVLRRDALLAHYQRLLSGQGDSQTLQTELKHTLQALDEDFSFIARCNQGDVPLTDADQARLARIATRRWMRHYSDRIGISAAELRRKQCEVEPVLPVSEPLLADKAEHRIARSRSYTDLKDMHGEPLAVPEHEYDHGELYNLSIRRGTLTEEERFKINEHMLIGLEMLKRIPFPSHLARVPEIALSHHETLIGTGYPLRKHKKHLSVEARILAIADIFEALTAADRPYKKTKTCSQALAIMQQMRDTQHIDPDLFDLFLQAGVFKEYAAMYLSAAQNDVTDITPYLSQTAQTHHATQAAVPAVPMSEDSRDANDSVE